MTEMIKPRKAAIIGIGHVGSHVASALVTQGLVSELVLIDTDRAKAEAHGADLADTICWMPHSARVWAGDYSDCADAELMIISASGPFLKRIVWRSWRAVWIPWMRLRPIFWNAASRD